jgi:site-specific recombinase XerC
MAKRHDLQYSINQVLLKNRDGSYATLADRKQILMRFANDLHDLGFGLTHVQGLKTKHIEAVVEYWKAQNLSNATLKNRTAALRYIAHKLNKINVAPSNTTLGIGARHYVAKTNKALPNPDFSKIGNIHILHSLQLQRLFGLRREEALKIKPFLADQTSHLILQPSWCKGGRGRIIPIRTEEQRLWLENAKQLAGRPECSLIPSGKSYIQQRYLYDKQTLRAGLQNLHGLRHAYAQQRYRELTGWEAPINGGPKSKQLTEAQRVIDKQARMLITEELGHSREQITASYLSR